MKFRLRHEPVNYHFSSPLLCGKIYFPNICKFGLSLFIKYHNCVLSAAKTFIVWDNTVCVKIRKQSWSVFCLGSRNHVLDIPFSRSRRFSKSRPHAMLKLKSRHHASKNDQVRHHANRWGASSIFITF